jgi:hypothetical protein
MANMSAPFAGCSNRECHYQAELYRLRGTVLAATGEDGEGASCLHQAIDTAAASRQSKRAQAHDLLAPISGWFTEGIDTAGLKDAKALLDELA